MLNFFKKFSRSAAKSTKKIFKDLFSSSKLDESTVDDIEKALFSADFGVKTTQDIINSLKGIYKRDKSLTSELAIEATKGVIADALRGSEAAIPQRNDNTQVICLIGVNGSGKTTTAAKLAKYYRFNGSSVMFAACDTFRAAANEQINIWADRLGINIVNGQPGSDSAAVAYDAYQSARAKKCDFLIIDTAGRLHVKSNLMNELKKISNTLKKVDPQVQLQNWLVLDGNVGSNSLEVAKTFNADIGVHGIIVTKLDGSSRGGAIVSIYREMQIPVFFIGTGEQLDDLKPFVIKEYIESLF